MKKTSFYSVILLSVVMMTSTVGSAAPKTSGPSKIPFNIFSYHVAATFGATVIVRFPHPTVQYPRSVFPTGCDGLNAHFTYLSGTATNYTLNFDDFNSTWVNLGGITVWLKPPVSQGSFGDFNFSQELNFVFARDDITQIGVHVSFKDETVQEFPFGEFTISGYCSAD